MSGLNIAFSLYLLVTLTVALVIGGFPERLTALILLLAAAASPLVVRNGFLAPELGLFTIDAVLALYLFGLALVSNRFWPMWAAAFQLASVTIHLARLVDNTIGGLAYATAEVVWSYPVLGALAVGTWLEVRRKLSL